MPSPILIQFGSFQLRWYGVFAGLALLTAYLILSLRIKKSPLTADDISTLLGTCAIFGISGARLEYIRRFWDFYTDDFSGIFRIWEGGLVFQGGFILAVLAVLLLCRLKKWSVGSVGDLMALALPCAHAVSRIGCLLNGCCFGAPSSSCLAVQYPAVNNDVLQTQIFLGQVPADATTPLPVLPTQAIETLWCLIVAAVIYYCEKKDILKNRRFFIYILGYSIGRFFLEFLRGDYHQASGLTPAQWTTAWIIPVTIAVMVWSSYKKPASK